MKLATWNVNSVRARLPRVLAFLDRHEPDVLVLQETKARNEDFPSSSFVFKGYQAVSHGQPTYNGVAVLSRVGLEDVQAGFPKDPCPDQARVLTATCGGVRVVDLYVVNGKHPDHADYQLKLTWLDALTAWLEDLLSDGTPTLVMGDLNIAPTDGDVHDPAEWEGHNLVSPAERERFQGLLDVGLVDLTRLHHEPPGPWTWWDLRGLAFPKGEGLRIDHILGTPDLAERCTGVEVDREERKKSTGEGGPSDHAPVLVDLSNA